MTESVQSGYKALPNTINNPSPRIKNAEQTSIDQDAVECSLCDLSAGLDNHIKLKKLSRIMDNCIPTQTKMEK